MEDSRRSSASLTADTKLACHEDLRQQKQEEIVISRAYQLEMFEKSMHRNIIVTMETGSGKTWIAKLRIEAELARRPDKLVWFTAPTVVLAGQQHKYLSSHLTSSSTRLITGSDNTHLWSTQKVWDALLDVNLIVSTPQILLEGLQLGFVQLQRISLLVIDEAHHCLADDPSNRTMRRFYHEPRRTNSTTELPFILGMTASPITTKLKNMDTLESNIDAVCMSPTKQIEEYRKNVHLPEIVALDYPLQNSRQSLPIELMLRIPDSVDIHKDPWVKHLSQENTPGASHKLLKVLETKSTFSMDQLKKLKGNTEHLYLQLGPWATHVWLKQILLKLHLKVESKEWLVGISDKEHCYLDEVLGEIRDLSCKAIEEGSIVHQLSAKSEFLVNFLEKEYAENVSFSCVIFVERRSTAYALRELLQSHPSISCAVASFVGSSNSGKKVNLIDLADVATQKAELDEFRSGLRSIVVATSAVEEGIDIQATNMVVLFDHALTVKSYIQRRGRARKVASKFVVMRSSEDCDLKYADFMRLEAEMKARYQEENRQVQMRLRLEDQDENIDQVYAIASTGAQLTFENARSLLGHYCQSLNKVEFEPNPHPTFIFQGGHESENISAKVILPSSLPSELREVCGTGIWRTEKLATRDAAYEAVKKLHETGLVNDHLLPPAMAKRDASSVETRTIFTDIEPQTNPWLPICSELDEDILLRVYRCEFSGLPLDDASNTISEAHTRPSPLLLLLPTKLESGINVPLRYSALQTLQASVSYIEDRNMSVSSRILAQEVTSYLIRTTLRAQTKDPEGWKRGRAFFLLPDLPENDLRDWFDLSKRCVPLATLLMESSSPEQTFALSHTRANGVCISNLKRWDWMYQESLFALPKAIPAVLARKLPKKIDYLTKRSLPSAKAAPRSSISGPPSATTGEKMVLEISECTVLPHLSLSLIATMQFIPSILRMVEFALVARICCKSLLQHCGIVNEARLLEALVSPLASGDINYERLEFYGDTLLKLYACLQVYSEPRNSNLPEGYLTMRATKLVTNARLQRAGVEIGLDQFMIHEPFIPRAWKPETRTAQEVKTKRKTSTKIIADHVEAIIAVAYLDDNATESVIRESSCISASNQNDAKAVELLNTLMPEMRWRLPCINAAAVSARPPIHHQSFDALTVVESMLGYTFQKRHLLAEALNHSSILNHVPTYGRLEFLGDAVLQRIVNEAVYHAPARYPQGAMHLRQIVCVSHPYLAFLCLGAHHDVERVNVTTDLAQQKATLHRTIERKYLWEFMAHSNPAIAPAQQRSLNRYLECGDQIRKQLETSKTYPWALLASIAAPKFISDLVESVLGAVYIDSHADLGICANMLGKLGLAPLLQRLLDEPDMILEQPKDLLWQARQKAGLPGLKVVSHRRDEVSAQKYHCQLTLEGEVYATVADAWCKEEAMLRACEIGLERFGREQQEMEALGIDVGQISLEDEESGGPPKPKRKREDSSPEASPMESDSASGED